MSEFDIPEDAVPTTKGNPFPAGEEKGTGARPTVREAAKDTVAKVSEDASALKSKAGVISRIREKLTQQPELLEPPVLMSSTEVELNEQYLDLVHEMLKIVMPYQQDGFDLNGAHLDAVRLASMLVTFSPQIGFAEARCEHLERSLKAVRARVFLAAKSTAQAEGGRVTDDEAEQLAHEYSAPVLADLGSSQMVWKYLYNILMSLRMFTEILNASAQREHQANQNYGRHAS